MDSDSLQAPWIKLRSGAYQTFIYQKMVREASPDTQPGDCVTVYDKHGDIFGHGLYNPRSQIAVRMLNYGALPIDAAFWRRNLERAVVLRTKTLNLDATTDAYRLIHAEGDDLSGLIVDRYGDVLSIEVFSLGMWRQVETLLPVLHELAGTKHHRVNVDARVQQLEGFTATPLASEGLRDTINITENGVRFRVCFETGHKTGFFCDQRENRKRLATVSKDADVLDLCCYSGGFGLYAKVLGGAKEATCVDLDEAAVAMAKRNANLNQARINTVHSDAFTYMRQMQGNNRQYDVVVLDPPKLIFNKREIEEGRRKYHDLNRLATMMVKPGGILLTCSCSGTLQPESFRDLALDAVRRVGRRCQILNIAGASPDHPVSPMCPESAYLKAVWLRVL